MKKDGNFLDSTVVETLLTGSDREGDLKPLKMVDLFLAEAPLLLERLAKGVQTGDNESVKNSIKIFKMISAEIGANSFLSHFEKLELAFPEGDTEKIQSLFSLIENCYLKLLNILNVLKLSIDKGISEVAEIKTCNNKKGYILVIDDDSVFRVLLTELLESMNYEVEVASSGLEGLEKAYTRLPDLVLLDAIMDGIDGFETCKIFKSDLRLSPVPIVMVTGLDDSESISRAFDTGATNFISKPVQPMLLENQIRFIFRTMDIENQLRESESKLKISQRLARLGHWRLNAGSGLFEYSEQLATLCDNNNIQSGGSFAAFLMNIHPDDRVYVLDTIGAALQGQATDIIKYRLKLNGSDELHVEQFIEVLHSGTRVESILGTVQDVSRQRDVENSIRQIAFQDNLTGLASRGYFMEHLGEVIKTANRQGGQLALLLIDLDGFKAINDGLGHDAGDSLLKKVAMRLKGTLRKSDFIARLGDDEFCILISEISKEGSTAKIAVNCLEAVSAPLILNGRTIKPKISIGIAHYPNDADAKDGLLKAADIAMHDAKTEGKHRYAFFNKQMMEQVEQSFTYEQELNAAIRENQFELLYQPVISLASGKLVAVEALVRWLHPDRGLISPTEFLSTLERLDLAPTMFEWVLDTACNQLDVWKRNGLSGIRMALNISHTQLADDRLFEAIAKKFSETDIRPDLLTLEINGKNNHITDDSAMNSLKALKTLGINISMDDFGAGYSSLASLKNSLFDCLKIDRMFIHDLADNTQSAILSAAVIGMANELGYTFVAKGVETLEQVQTLADFGCDQFQGYYFSHPVRAVDISSLSKNDFKLQ